MQRWRANASWSACIGMRPAGWRRSCPSAERFRNEHGDKRITLLDYSVHGLRKYAAMLRPNLGATAHEFMAWLGWLTIREAERNAES